MEINGKYNGNVVKSDIKGSGIMEKYNRVIIILSVFLLILFSLCTINYASGIGLGNLDDYKTDPKMSDNIEFMKIMNNIISGVATVGSVLSIIILMVMGIKYMMGSLEERAEYKKTLVPYMIGAIFVFGASNIANLIFTVAKDLF